MRLDVLLSLLPADAFVKFDLTGSGSIPGSSLSDALRAAGRDPASVEAVRSKDFGDDPVDFSEFLQIAAGALGKSLEMVLLQFYQQHFPSAGYRFQACSTSHSPCWY